MRAAALTRSSSLIRCITALISARRENAWGSSSVPPGMGVDLLGVQEQRAGQGQQLLAQRPGTGHLTDPGQRRDQRERSDRERAFLAAELVDGSLDAVAQHELVLGELVGDGQDGSRDPVVIGRQEADQRDQQRRSMGWRRVAA
jgi:hypothetical protein